MCIGNIDDEIHAKCVQQLSNDFAKIDIFQSKIKQRLGVVNEFTYKAHQNNFWEKNFKDAYEKPTLLDTAEISTITSNLDSTISNVATTSSLFDSL